MSVRQLGVDSESMQEVENLDNLDLQPLSQDFKWDDVSASLDCALGKLHADDGTIAPLLTYSLQELESDDVSHVLRELEFRTAGSSCKGTHMTGNKSNETFLNATEPISTDLDVSRSDSNGVTLSSQSQSGFDSLACAVLADELEISVPLSDHVLSSKRSAKLSEALIECRSRTGSENVSAVQLRTAAEGQLSSIDEVAPIAGDLDVCQRETVLQSTSKEESCISSPTILTETKRRVDHAQVSRNEITESSLFGSDIADREQFTAAVVTATPSLSTEASGAAAAVEANNELQLLQQITPVSDQIPNNGKMPNDTNVENACRKKNKRKRGQSKAGNTQTVSQSTVGANLRWIQDKMRTQNSEAKRANQIRSMCSSFSTTLPLNNVDTATCPVTGDVETPCPADDDLMESIELVSVEMRLKQIDRQLRTALKVDNVCVERCCELLHEIRQLPLTVDMLMRYPFLAGTVNACCRLQSPAAGVDSVDIYVQLRNAAAVANASITSLFARREQELGLKAYNRQVADYRRNLAINQYQKQLEILLTSNRNLSPLTDLYDTSNNRDFQCIYSVWDQFFVEHCDPNHELIRLDDNSPLDYDDDVSIEPVKMGSYLSVNETEDIKPDVEFLMSQMHRERGSVETPLVQQAPPENEMKEQRVIRNDEESSCRNSTGRINSLLDVQPQEDLNDMKLVKMEPEVANGLEVTNCQLVAGFSGALTRKRDKARKTCKRFNKTTTAAVTECEPEIGGEMNNCKKMKICGSGSNNKPLKGMKEEVPEENFCSRLRRGLRSVRQTDVLCGPVCADKLVNDQNNPSKVAKSAVTSFGVKRSCDVPSSRSNKRAAKKKISSDSSKSIGQAGDPSLLLSVVVKIEPIAECENTVAGAPSSSGGNHNRVLSDVNSSRRITRSSYRKKITSDNSTEKPVKDLSSAVNETSVDQSCMQTFKSESMLMRSARMNVSAVGSYYAADADADGGGGDGGGGSVVEAVARRTRSRTAGQLPLPSVAKLSI